MAVSHVMNIISNAGSVSAGTGSGGGGGGGSSLDTQTVTVGSATQNNAGGSGAPSSVSVWKGFGFQSSTNFGSISDGTSNLYSGASIIEISYAWDSVYGIGAVKLIISGNNRANSGWSTMTIGSTAYTRTSSTYAGTSGSNTSWSWFQSGDTTGSGSPFGITNGVTVTVTFT